MAEPSDYDTGGLDSGCAELDDEMQRELDGIDDHDYYDRDNDFEDAYYGE